MSFEKGDCISGLAVRVGELVTLRIIRGMLEDKMVWDVYLETSVKESTFKKIMKDL